MQLVIVFNRAECKIPRTSNLLLVCMTFNLFEEDVTKEWFKTSGRSYDLKKVLIFNKIYTLK